ncbi:hypothetical protein [Acinetobacter colistiniresistens]|uniref:hypothetical protein n=1 Tax=Acinetobacter colistiniresistens TaxID=280145 RepID=UPI000FD72DE9|nr:hypothetical protein [Acinetobacter colistiniresistens]
MEFIDMIGITKDGRSIPITETSSLTGERFQTITIESKADLKLLPLLQERLVLNENKFEASSLENLTEAGKKSRLKGDYSSRNFIEE